jgi:hypothetical protein
VASPSTARCSLTDFMNLKINPTQSFRCAHINMMCIYIFIEVSAHTCMSIYIFLIYDHQLSIIGMFLLGKDHRTFLQFLRSCHDFDGGLLACTPSPFLDTISFMIVAYIPIYNSSFMDQKNLKSKSNTPFIFFSKKNLGTSKVRF